MNTVLALLGGAPVWVVYAVVGGVLGALSALVGAGIDRLLGTKIGRFMVIAGLAITPVVTRNFVIPAVEIAFINKDLPRKIDDVTTLLQFSSSNGRYVYVHQIDEAVPEDFDVTLIKQANLPSLCQTFGPSLRSGALSSVEYRYQRNADVPKSFFVTTPDC